MSAPERIARGLGDLPKIRFVRDVPLETERDYHEAFTRGSIVADNPAAARYQRELAAKFTN